MVLIKYDNDVGGDETRNSGLELRALRKIPLCRATPNSYFLF